MSKGQCGYPAEDLSVIGYKVLPLVAIGPARLPWRRWQLAAYMIRPTRPECLDMSQLLLALRHRTRAKPALLPITDTR
jgi:hypothetical protein